MNKLETNDLQILGALVAASRHLLLGRAEGTVIMDSETIETIESILIGVSIIGETFAMSGIFTEAQFEEVGLTKLQHMGGKSTIEDVILGALYHNKARAIAKIRREHSEANPEKMLNLLKDLMERSEASGNDKSSS